MTDTSATVDTLDAAANAPALAEQPTEAPAPTPEEVEAAKEAEVAAAEKAAEEAAKAEAEAKAAADRKARIAAAVQRRQAQQRAQQRQAAELAQARQQLAMERAERERLAAFREQIARNPLEAVRGMGVTARALAEKAVAEGTPEEKIALLEQRLNETTAQYETRLKELAAQQERREYEAREAAARSQMMEISRSDSDRHDLLMARYGTERALIGAITEVAREAHEKSGGRFRYMPEEILEHLAKETNSLAERLAAKKSGSKVVAGKPESKVAGTAASTGSTAAKPSAPRTLTQSTATEAFVMPDNFDKLSDAQQNEILAEQLRRAWGGSA